MLFLGEGGNRKTFFVLVSVRGQLCLALVYVFLGGGRRRGGVPSFYVPGQQAGVVEELGWKRTQEGGFLALVEVWTQSL
jgi:hypothetical protein